MKNFSKYLVGFILGLLVMLCFTLLFLVFISKYEITNRVDSLELIAKLNKERGSSTDKKLYSMADVIEVQNTQITKLKKEVKQLTANPPKDGKDGSNGSDGYDGRDGQDGYTPIKGIDYFDGVNGTDGKDGVDGEDAPLILIQCNVEKNRWEYKYYGDLTWSIMNDEPVPCTFKEEGV